MRYGHAVNSVIPEDPNEAEFPPEPWAKQVMIRVKSAPSPKALMAPLPAGGDPSQAPPAPGLPSTWTGPTFGQAPPIDEKASGLVTYVSPNQSRPADGELEEDEELARLRGTLKTDEEVGKITAWTTLKDYPTLIGICLPVRDWVGEDYHEIQFWEETLSQSHSWNIRLQKCSTGSWEDSTDVRNMELSQEECQTHSRICQSGLIEMAKRVTFCSSCRTALLRA
jgi:hypothetical protein